MSDIFSSLLKDVEISLKCESCGSKPTKQNVLRCPECDLPFAETEEGIRALAFALQNVETKTFYNVSSQVVCYTWLRLERGYVDLDIAPLDDCEDFGTPPDWYDLEISESGWDSILGAEWKGVWSSDSPFDGTWNNWALEKGLCPNQPFLVELKPPRYYQCSWEYPAEYDVEHDWDIVLRVPRSPRQAARSWDSWKIECARNREAHKKAEKRKAYQRSHDVEAMYIRYDQWGGSYDYSTGDQGYIVALCSNHGGGWLLQGRSPSDEENRARLFRNRDIDPIVASYENAWVDLIRQVKEYHPHLDPDMVRKLPVRYNF